MTGLTESTNWNEVMAQCGIEITGATEAETEDLSVVEVMLGESLLTPGLQTSEIGRAHV